jgi:hypothetical protein
MLTEDEMKHSEQLNELATALAQYQASAKNPNNSASNPFLKNKYAPLNEILNEVRPELAKHGLSVSQLVGGEDRIGVTTMLLHKSGQYIADTVSLTPDSSKGLSTAQNAGVVITYLRRYGVTAILGIAGEDDTDGHSESKPVQQPKETQHVVWQKAVSAEAKKAGCTDKDKFYESIYRKFPQFPHDDGILIWAKINATQYASLLQFFESGEWNEVVAREIFEDDIPI